MTVYVDNMRAPLKVNGRDYVMCHMLADSDDELHAMADRIGLSRAYWQQPPKVSTSHYDITQSKRALAIEAGAVVVEMRELAAMAASRRIRGFLGEPAQSLAWFVAYRAEQGVHHFVPEDASRKPSNASSNAEESAQLMLRLSE